MVMGAAKTQTSESFASFLSSFIMVENECEVNDMDTILLARYFHICGRDDFRRCRT